MAITSTGRPTHQQVMHTEHWRYPHPFYISPQTTCARPLIILSHNSSPTVFVLRQDQEAVRLKRALVGVVLVALVPGGGAHLANAHHCDHRNYHRR